MKRFRDLRVLQSAKALCVQTYRVTQPWPETEKFGLIGQIRRASVSIASNIAEGSARGTDADYARFLRMAQGSLAETITLLEIARDLEYGDATAIDALKDEYESLAPSLASLVSSISQGRVREHHSAYDLVQSD